MVGVVWVALRVIIWVVGGSVVLKGEFEFASDEFELAMFIIANFRVHHRRIIVLY